VAYFSVSGEAEILQICSAEDLAARRWRDFFPAQYDLSHGQAL